MWFRLVHMDQTTPPQHEGLAAVITSRRQGLGLSQNKVAADSAIPHATFVRRMRRNDWTLDEVTRIAETLQATPSDLMAEAEHGSRGA